MKTHGVIHAGTTIRDGIKTAHYSDVVDALPPDIRDYRTLVGPYVLNAEQLDSFHKAEAVGWRISWQVGNANYFSKENAR